MHISRNHPLALAICLALVPLHGLAQEVDGSEAASPRSSVTTTSNSTGSNATKRVQQLNAVQVQASSESVSLGGGNMQYQDAAKSVSTIGREAIVRTVPGANFTQMLTAIPGATSSTNDVTGLNDGQFSVRGYPADEIGVTVNGVPINDSGDYSIYATEYGDTENMGDITVEQGFPSVTSPVLGAAGGNIAWVTVNPTHQAGVDFSQSLGSNDYRRTFLRYNTGDLGPVRSWISYSHNESDLWRGAGSSEVTKIDAKSVWTIDDGNSITASLQYNRELLNKYKSLTKSEAHQDYHQGYSGRYDASAPWDYARLNTQPFRSWILSLDGEFTLSDSLHLSVVPYFVYGYGGGGWGDTFDEGSYGVDANGNGSTSDSSVPVFNMWTSNTYRPGIQVKFKQDLGLDDSLEYGVWYERPRNQQNWNLLPLSSDGDASDAWGQNTAYMLHYANGNAVQLSRFYSVTDTKRVFATNTWTPSDQWTFTLGGAYTWVERKGYYAYLPGSGLSDELYATGSAKYSKFTPTAGVKFQLDDANQFYFGIGQSYRAPISTAVADWFYNEAYAATTGVASSEGKPKAESSWTADLGWRFYGERASAVIDAYYSDFRNKQVSGTDPNTSQSVYTTLDKVLMRGVNGEFSYKLDDHWNVYASYAYTSAKMRNDLTSGGETYATDGKQLINTPKHVGNLALNYTQGPAWASLKLNVRSGIWADWENTAGAGGYSVLNFDGGWNFADAGWLKKPYIKLNVWNLTNREAFTYADSVTTFRSSGDDSWYLLQDRTFIVTLGTSFDL